MQKFWITSVLIAAMGVYVGLASGKPTKTGSLKIRDYRSHNQAASPSS